MPPYAKLQDVVIVLVEDHDDIRSYLSDFLVRKGATVFTCSSALEGLQAVRRCHPNVVLSDISLPDQSGFDLLHDIRSLGSENGGGVPVIAMTALSGIVDRDSTIAAGFKTHLDKPFRPDQLLDAVVSALH
jgi:CheY-like chemotaxis protein